MMRDRSHLDSNQPKAKDLYDLLIILDHLEFLHDPLEFLDAPEIRVSHPFERKVGEEVGGVLETTQNALQSAIHEQVKCSKNIKALHKPLQTIPRSIHPIGSVT